MSITPSVAHKNTNNNTPTRCNQRRAAEAGLEVETDPRATGRDASVDFISPTRVESVAKGSLGSEIIARVVLSKAVERARERPASPRKL
jgi:hypothetical protein